MKGNSEICVSCFATHAAVFSFTNTDPISSGVCVHNRELNF
jgi:hypothetical protein